MYERLDQVVLKGGEAAELGVVVGPDADWAERIDGDLLAHKGPVWRWGNRAVLQEDLDLEAYFYILHRNGAPFANVMTLEYRGVGILGHVFTKPEDRRKGAARAIFERLMPHFRQRGGRALILGTGYDSPPYHIYRSFGFESIEPLSGVMVYYTDSQAAFEDAFLASGAVGVARLGPAHYPVAPILFGLPCPGVVRMAAVRAFGRGSSEGFLLGLLKEELERQAENRPARTAMLVQQATGAVMGCATTERDATWPDTRVVDLFCHPDCWDRGADLLQAIELPAADRTVAYCDAGFVSKEAVLETMGFRQIATFAQWVAMDRAKTGFVDVGVWERR